MQVYCGTPLESSQGELQVCFRPHPDRRSEQGVKTYQSPGSPIRDIFGTVSGPPLGSSETNNHLDVASMEWHKVYYMGKGGGFPQVWAVVNQVNPELFVACSNIKGALEGELTNLLVGLMQV